ncbi:MAG: TrkA C-terminal domain-containing protein [Bacillota bacterium]|jgi:K+/H+ antiporter YhaU regulatory subunit KhtT
MQKNVKISPPRYQQVAADVAAKIAKKHYLVGDRIYARSGLASQYGVSSETARRAICVLADMGIVEATKGSGVVVKSYENAVKFVQHYQDIQSAADLKREILGIIERQTEENKKLKECIGRMMDKTDRFRSINPFTPFDMVIDSTCHYIGKTLSEVNFWHNTTATVIAIRRNDTLLLSPGPYSVLMEGDVIYFIGEDKCFGRVKKFLYGSSERESASGICTGPHE